MLLTSSHRFHFHHFNDAATQSSLPGFDDCLNRGCFSIIDFISCSAIFKSFRFNHQCWICFWRDEKTSLSMVVRRRDILRHRASSFLPSLHWYSSPTFERHFPSEGFLNFTKIHVTSALGARTSAFNFHAVCSLPCLQMLADYHLTTSWRL